MVSAILALALIVCGAVAEAGGLADPPTGDAAGATASPPPIAGFDYGVVGEAEAGAALAARGLWNRRLTRLWRSEANGTCLGILGAWHLTPKRIFAEGTEFEILDITGSDARIAVAATRVWDAAPARFTFVPIGRKRVDVTGVVTGDPDRYNTPERYNAALRRCPGR